MAMQDLADLDTEGPAISPLSAGRGPATMAAVGPWRLMLGKLLRQKVAMAAARLVLLLYLVGAFAEFLAPSQPGPRRGRNTPTPRRRGSACS